MIGKGSFIPGIIDGNIATDSSITHSEAVKLHFERIDLHLDNAQKLNIIDNCKNNYYQSFGKYKVQRVETIDGFKFFFAESEFNHNFTIYSWSKINP